MDPEHALYLTSQRLARRLTGHTQKCGCEECTLFGKLLGSDTGLRRAVTELACDCRIAAKGAIEALTGETL